jgi:DMSO/TMAO reductase YedYZ molybdopterin-dependent catalytic subunit
MSTHGYSTGEERNACLAIDPVGFHLRPPPPPHELGNFITPDAQLFETIHMGAAVVSAERWRLVIDGLVQKPVTLSLADLRRLPHVTMTAFHEYYGSPLAPSVKALWRIGNVAWTGVRLQTLLALAEPLPSCRAVRLVGGA